MCMLNKRTPSSALNTTHAELSIRVSYLNKVRVSLSGQTLWVGDNADFTAGCRVNDTCIQADDRANEKIRDNCDNLKS